MSVPSESHDMKEMEQHHEIHESQGWLDQYWWLLLIAFGLIFVLWLALFHPPAWW